MPDKYLDSTGTVAPSTETVVEPEPTPDFATKEDIAEIKGAMEQITLSMKNFGQPAPAAPIVPTGPSLEEEVAKLDSQLTALDEPFEQAVQEGKGVAAIQRKREALIQKRADMIHNRDMDELRSFGTFAISGLTDEVVKDKLELLRIPEVQAAYDTALASMTPEQKMNPETRMLAYKFACGENMDKIFDLKLQEHLRQEKEVETQAPTTPGRTQEPDTKHPDYVPDPSEILSKDNLEAIRFAGKDVESYYQSLGFDGWDDYWKQVGRADYEGGEE